jgi:hypothetical protein
MGDVLLKPLRKNHTSYNKKTVLPIPHGSFTSAGFSSASMVFTISHLHRLSSHAPRIFPQASFNG